MVKTKMQPSTPHASGFGKRVKLLRIKKRMTQQELADKMGYTSKTTITKIESGTTGVVKDRLQGLAEVLGTTTQYLLTGEDEPAETQEVTEIMRKANDAERKQILSFARYIRAFRDSLPDDAVVFQQAQDAPKKEAADD